MNRLLAVVGSTACGKSAMGLALAEAFDGEIVSCDSTAVYQGLDIGTDKTPVDERRGVPHHLIDVVPPTDVYSAARYASDAAGAVREITARGRLPILVGGTGFYFQALVRGLFPGPTRHDELRDRLNRIAARRGPEALHRWLGRRDPVSAARIMPRDLKRIVRALEVYLLTGRAISDHFDTTVSLIPDYRVLTIGIRMPRPDLRVRVARRVDEQFTRGVVQEVEALIAGGMPAASHAFSGLVYRQIIELLGGVRNEADTRHLIVRENMRYAKRQLKWFRKRPETHWLDGPGETPAALAAAIQIVDGFLRGLTID
ncbi:MAG: tRNA (adenosine(37)-N6)-dimethylallyltransferase MiaA [Acidobacteriota bacterium]